MKFKQSCTQEFCTAVGKILERERKRKRLTQADVAAVADVRPNTIAWYESGGGTPAMSTLLRIVQLLQIDWKELTGLLRHDRKTYRTDQRLRTPCVGQRIEVQYLDDIVPKVSDTNRMSEGD